MNNLLWLNNRGAIIKCGDEKLVLSDDCPCGGEVCSASFKLRMENSVIDTTVCGVVNSKRYRANTIAPGREAICSLQLLAKIPAGGQIKQVQVTSQYGGTGDRQNLASFYATNVTSSISGNSVRLNIVHALKSIWFRPVQIHWGDFTFTITYKRATNNEGACAVSLISSETTLGSAIKDSAYVVYYGNDHGYYREMDGVKKCWSYYDLGTMVVPADAGKSPPYGTRAYRPDYESIESYELLGAHRQAWYDDVTPVPYSEIQGNGDVLVSMDGENILERIEGNTSTPCRAFILLRPYGAIWTDNRNPNRGDTVYYTSDGAFVAHDRRVDDTATYSAGWSPISRLNFDYCNQCNITRGGVMTVPEEFE